MTKNDESNISIKQTIAIKLLKAVFSIYFIITAGVTSLQIFVEYEGSKNLIIEELKAIELSNHLALSQAFWNLDEEQINKIADGLIQLKLISYLSFTSPTENIAIKRLNDQQPSSLITHNFPLTYQQEDSVNTIFLANVSLSSNNSIVIERIQTKVTILILAAIFKTLTLWLLMFWVFKRLLSKPLGQLTTAIQSVDLEHLDEPYIQKHHAENNELQLIETSFNTMLSKLNEQKIQLLGLKKEQLEESKRHNLELHDLLKQAKETTDTKSQFLSTMSHQIRTPMNGVIGMAQLLNDTGLNHEQQDYLNSITHSGNHLINIINNVLDFSKLDANMVSIEKISFDFERVCQECLELVSANNDTVEFVLDYAPQCPRFLMADPSRLRQVLLNLLSNAKKFTSTGFIRLSVQSNVIHDTITSLKVDVQDTGIGLRPGIMKHIFDEFSHRNNSANQQYSNTGLGLSITKKILSLMNCRIGVSSVFGEGSTFWFEGDFELADSPSQPLCNTLTDIPILLLSSNAENRRVFNRLLAHMGTNITIISSNKDTIPLLINAKENLQPFSIVILDQRLAEDKCIETGFAIRQHFSHDELKLLILSSCSQKGSASLFTAAGFNAYLSKLTRYDTLRMMLCAMLEQKSSDPIITQHSIEESQNEHSIQHSFKGRVLLAEDIVPNQIIAHKFLSAMGLTVDIANNGQEAIDAYSAQHYDMIFMDCCMPKVDGYEATKAIRKLEKATQVTTVPIIALTANASINERKRCEESGMNEILTKPFKRSDLSDCLLNWLPPLDVRSIK